MSCGVLLSQFSNCTAGESEWDQPLFGAKVGCECPVIGR